MTPAHVYCNLFAVANLRQQHSGRNLQLNPPPSRAYASASHLVAAFTFGAHAVEVHGTLAVRLPTYDDSSCNVKNIYAAAIFIISKCALLISALLCHGQKPTDKNEKVTDFESVTQ